MMERQGIDREVLLVIIICLGGIPGLQAAQLGPGLGQHMPKQIE